MLEIAYCFKHISQVYGFSLECVNIWALRLAKPVIVPYILHRYMASLQYRQAYVPEDGRTVQTVTYLTSVWLFSSMNQHMKLETSCSVKVFMADKTNKLSRPV